MPKEVSFNWVKTLYILYILLAVCIFHRRPKIILRDKYGREGGGGEGDLKDATILVELFEHQNYVNPIIFSKSEFS